MQGIQACSADARKHASVGKAYGASASSSAQQREARLAGLTAGSASDVSAGTVSAKSTVPQSAPQSYRHTSFQHTRDSANLRTVTMSSSDAAGTTDAAMTKNDSVISGKSFGESGMHMNPFQLMALNAGTMTDTFGMTLQAQKPPEEGAPMAQQMQYLHYQLDTILGKEVLHGLVLEPGQTNRMQGGARHAACALPLCVGIKFDSDRIVLFSLSDFTIFTHTKNFRSPVTVTPASFSPSCVYLYVASGIG